MSTDTGIDLRAGVPLRDLSDHPIVTGRGGEDDVILLRGGRTLAVATIGRDRQGLDAELAMETAS